MRKHTYGIASMRTGKDLVTGIPTRAEALNIARELAVAHDCSMLVLSDAAGTDCGQRVNAAGEVFDVTNYTRRVS